MSENELLAGIERLFDIKIQATEKLLNQAILDLDKRFTANTAMVAEHTLAMTAASQKAAEIMAVDLERRLSEMNEFRSTLSDQAKNFFTRQEHELFAKSVDADIRTLRESRAEIKGMAKASQLYLTFIVALVGAIAGVISLVLRVLGK